MAVITASPSNFMKLLDLQQKSLDHMQTIRTIIEQGGSRVTIESDKQQTKFLDKISKDSDENLKVVKESRKEQKTLSKKEMEERAALIASIAESTETFRTFGDRFKDLQKGFKDSFGSKESLKITGLKALNFGGIFDKAIKKQEFIKEQKAMGSEKSDKELAADFKQRNEIAKQIKENEEKIAKFAKMTGLSESKIGKTKLGSELLAMRAELSEKFAPTDMRAKFVGDEGDSEAAIEQAEHNEDMLETQQNQEKSLYKIEEYLKPNNSNKSGDSGGGGGMLGGLADGLKKLGPVLTKFGGSVGKGIMLFFEGLGKGLAALASPITLLGLGAFTLAMMGIGKALEYAAPAFEAIAPVLMKVAEVIGVTFVTAIENIPATLTAIGDVITSIGGGIAKVIETIADSIVKVVTAVRKLFGIADPDSQEAKNAKTNVPQNVGKAVKNMASGAVSGGKSNSGIPESARVMINDSDDPEVRRLEDVIENGSRSESARARNQLDIYRMKRDEANKVNRSSAENAGLAANNSSGGGNTVVAPVTNNTQQTKNVVVKLPTRNQDSSYSRYLDSMYVAP